MPMRNTTVHLHSFHYVHVTIAANCVSESNCCVARHDIISSTQRNHQHGSLAVIGIFKLPVAAACVLNNTFRCNDEKRVL